MSFLNAFFKQMGRAGHLAQSYTELEDLAMYLKSDFVNLKDIFYSVFQLLQWGQNLLF